MRIPHTYTITALLILLAAVLTWFVPAGEYVRQTIAVGESTRTVIIPDSYHAVEQSPQTWQVFGVLLRGFERQAGIIAFLLIIGGAFQILAATRSVETGIRGFLSACSHAEGNPFLRRVGVNNLIIAAVITLFSLFGAVFGMSEETLAFVAIIIPLAISMGYDSITGLAMVYVAAHVGFSGAVLNPFTVGLAQGLSGLPIFSGWGYRFVCWLLLTTVLIAVVLVYAHRVKLRPESSPMFAADEYWRQMLRRGSASSAEQRSRSGKGTWIVFLLTTAAAILFCFACPTSTFSVGEASVTQPILPVLTAAYVVLSLFALRRGCQFFTLVMLLFTIVFLVVGVMAHGWYLTEISAIFLAMGILSGFACLGDVNSIISEFTTGAKDILSAAIVVGLASGIVIILDEGHITDTILHSMAQALDNGSRILAVEVMYVIQTCINVIIPSGSAKAALTMPIMAPFSDVIGLSRQATVMAYQFGDGFTNMITPTSGVLMGALALARIPYALWFRWFWRILLIFALIGAILLIPPVLFPIDGF